MSYSTHSRTITKHVKKSCEFAQFSHALTAPAEKFWYRTVPRYTYTLDEGPYPNQNISHSII